MSLIKLLDDPEIRGLIARVEETHGPDAVSRAITDAYVAIARAQQAQLAVGEAPDTYSLREMRAAFRRALEALMREH